MDLVLYAEPTFTVNNLNFADCIGTCIDTVSCIAVSYDRANLICYGFNSTEAPWKSIKGWVSVLIKQPLGLIPEFIYSRNTKISKGNSLTNSNTSTFLSCVDLCQHMMTCSGISYNFFATQANCQLFQSISDQSTTFLDSVYGTITAIHMSQISSNIDWMFSKVIYPEALKESADDDTLKPKTTEPYGRFPNVICRQQPFAGCNSADGTQACFYPENTNDHKNYPVCPDSILKTFDEERSITKHLITCFKICAAVTDSTCVGVDFSPSTRECIPLDKSYTFSTTPPPFFSRYNLRRSKWNSDMSFVGFGHYAKPVGQDWHTEDGAKTLADCLEICTRRNPQCFYATFHLGTMDCKLSGSSADIMSSGDAMEALFQFIPKLDSEFLAFRKMFRLSPSTDSRKLENVGGYLICEDYKKDTCESSVSTCLSACLFEDDCDYAAIKFFHDKKNGHYITCDLYKESSISFVGDPKGQIYMRISSHTTIVQENLDKLNIFQAHDFSKCFLSPIGQTFESVQTPPIEKNAVAVSNKHKGKRGAKEFFQSAWNGLVETAKDFGKTIYKTGESVVKLFNKDLEGAKKSFMEIPLVMDIKNTAESGIKFFDNVFHARWEEAGKNALDFGVGLAQFLPIPGGQIAGKLGSKVLKNVEKQIGKFGKNQKDELKDVLKKNKSDKPKNEQRKKDKEKKDKDEGKKACPKSSKGGRGKRATSTGRTRRPNDCEEDEDDNDNTCAISKTELRQLNADAGRGTCGKVRVGMTCDFICLGGYYEADKTPKCIKRNGADHAEFQQALRCTAYDCKAGSVPCTDTTCIFEVRAPLNNRISTEVPIYITSFNRRRKLPKFTIAYQDIINQGTTSYRKKKNRQGITTGYSDKFVGHPCPELMNRQTTGNSDFKMNLIDLGKVGKKGKVKVQSFDQGHLTPSVVNWFSYKAFQASNLYVNIAPQDPYTNEIPWQHLEGGIYCMLLAKTAIVVTGLCSGSVGKTVGGIEVPSCYYKLVCTTAPDGSVIVGGSYGNNSVVSWQSTTEKNQRSEDVRQFRSQANISSLTNWNPADWLLAAPLLLTRGATLDPTACQRATTLPANAPTVWKRKGSTRAGGVHDAAEYFGCTGDRFKQFAALFGFKSFDFDEEGDAEDEDTEEEREEEDLEAGPSAVTHISKCGKRVIGYYPSWGTARFTNSQARYLTHAVFAFFQTHDDGTVTLGSADPSNSADIGKDKEIAEKRLGNFLRVVDSFSELRGMFAVGGWENSKPFSGIAASAEKRLKFIASTIKILDQYDLDGIDIDWEHPVTGGAYEGVPDDRQNYVTLMKELRATLDAHAERNGRSEKYLISFAGAAGQWTLDPGLDLPGILKYANWANVMTYDYFGAWASKWGAYTGPPSPLFYGNPKGFSGKVNADWTLKYYTCKTKSPHQINMGVPFYGRYWENVGDPIDGSDGMWRLATAVNGKFEGGFVPWKEVQEKWISNPENVVTLHEKSKSPYAWNAAKKTFLGFENPASLVIKVKYAEEHNLGGIMIWALDQDDVDDTMLQIVAKANLCSITDPKRVIYRCPPIDERRWWTLEDGAGKEGLCGKSAPLFKGYYPLCDPEDPGYSCCGKFGYCGSGTEFCDCPTCVDYRKYPERILEEPIRPSRPVSWYLLNDPDGKRGRCGTSPPKLNGKFPICNPDDPNAHCCSNGDYCGSGPASCDCDGCVDFKKKPNFEYKDRKWFIWADGKDKFGKCGEKAPKLANGKVAECNPDSSSYCCSAHGFCGSGKEFCDCATCKNFKS